MENNTNQVLASPNKLELILQKQPIILQLLRFVAIGFLNTGLAFIIANLVSKYFGINDGNKLGASSAVGFFVATIQSYYWNKNWAFGEQQASLEKNFIRLVLVGCLGFFALALVYLGSQFQAPYYYYIGALLVFGVAQLALWKSFGLGNRAPAIAGAVAKNPAVLFFVVSLIGFVINFEIASHFSKAVHLTSNSDLNKNLALVAATAVSLIWNFIGYKIFVFKK